MASMAPPPVASTSQLAPNSTSNNNNPSTGTQAPATNPLLNLTQEKFRQIIGRVQELRQQGQSEQNSGELQQLIKLVHAIQSAQAQRQLGLAQQQQQNGDASTSTNGANGPRVEVPSPTASPPPVNFTSDQIASLKVQITAFKLLSRNQPLPAALHAAVLDPQAAVRYMADHPEALPSTSLGSSATTAAASAAAAEAEEEKKKERERLLAAEPGVEEVEDPDSLVYPYNAYHDPKAALSSFTRRPLLIPTLLPPGMDPQLLADERDRFIASRVAQRQKELEDLPANLSSTTLSPITNSSSSLIQSENTLKLRALIELKSLRLLSRQRELRTSILTSLTSSTPLVDRTLHRRHRAPTLRDARLTEKLEKRQKSERDLRAKEKHLSHLTAIASHAQALQAAHRAHQAKFGRMGKALLKFHADAERDETRRVERVSKERLKALRADDEEGYLKLIDTAKDTRITHLLRQTDAFLESLANAVVEQQRDAQDEVVPDPTKMDVEAPSTSEATFGAAPVFEEQEEEKKDKIDYYGVAHRIKESITAQPTILVGGQLKSYQLKGLEWMVSLYNNHVNGILADEMGLGKTIQTISLITFLIEVKKQHGPFLVIVPLSTMPNWIMEFEKWAPSVKMVSYKGTPTQRKQAQWEIRAGQFQVLLTTYEYIIKDRPLLARINWVHMIIDEGHRMKNAQSKLSVTLTTYYRSRYRLILTGTPLQNNLPELWALLNFVLPKIFGSVKSFDEWFNAPFANTGGQDKIEVNEEESLLVIRRLHKVLRPFLLRRLKKDVESDLPDKVERVIKCRMSSLQLKLTRQIKEHGMIFTDGPTDITKKATGIKGLQNQIMQLRKICNHPFTFEQVERSIDATGQTTATLYRVAGKFELLDRILPKLFSQGHRVLMFFQMTTVMTIFEDYLQFRRIEYLRLDGTTKHEDRSTLLKDFNAPNSKYPIFILSTRAGGLGLNLQSADTVIIFDSDWNPHQDLQAQDRAHRIGQKKEVRILRLVTERSVEEQVMAGASRKIEMDKKVIQAGKYDNKSTAEERDEYLRALLDVGEEEPEEDDEGDENEALNEAIARGEDERQIFNKMDRDRRAAEEAAWVAQGNTGKLPERLIQEWELPEVYRMEHVVHVVEDELADGVRRARTQVQYDDGLSEEQWLQGMEEEDDEDGPKKRRARGFGKKNQFLDPGSPGSDSTGRRRGMGFDSDDDDESSKKRKRGRVSAIGGGSGSMTPSVNGDDEDDSRGPGNKRRKVQLSPAQERIKTVAEACIDEMEELDNPTGGHQCTGLFNQLPSKRDYPDYFKVIFNPISLKEIRKKINGGLYRDLSDFQADINLMLNNARTFNETGSIVHTDAVLLQNTFDNAYARLSLPLS